MRAPVPSRARPCRPPAPRPPCCRQGRRAAGPAGAGHCVCGAAEAAPDLHPRGRRPGHPDAHPAQVGCARLRPHCAAPTPPVGVQCPQSAELSRAQTRTPSPHPTPPPPQQGVGRRQRGRAHPGQPAAHPAGATQGGGAAGLRARGGGGRQAQGPAGHDARCTASPPRSAFMPRPQRGRPSQMCPLASPACLRASRSMVHCAARLCVYVCVCVCLCWGLGAADPASGAPTTGRAWTRSPFPTRRPAAPLLQACPTAGRG